MGKNKVGCIAWLFYLLPLASNKEYNEEWVILKLLYDTGANGIGKRGKATKTFSYRVL